MKMRIAIVHDSLAEFGGAERVTQSLLKIFPIADVFSSVANPETVRVHFSGLPTNRLHTIFSNYKFWSQHTSLFQMYAPMLWRRLNLEKYDCVIVSSDCFMPNFIQVEKPICIQYIHSLPKNIFHLDPVTSLQRVIPYTTIIRALYVRAMRNTPYILTNSHHTQRNIRSLCGVDAVCMYPPVAIPSHQPNKHKGNYFLIVSRLDRTKSIELAIEACNRLHEKLVIVGIAREQSYDRYLRQIAGPTVQFLGFRSDACIASLYQNATALLFTPKNEDFGIVPVEAMAHGVPVIAYFGGGAKETVIANKTGIFFYEHNANALASAIVRFKKIAFDPSILYANASRFNVKKFQNSVRSYVRQAFSSRFLSK
jgi:glycosyltransferase involved in cell wall biosynthesis